MSTMDKIKAKVEQVIHPDHHNTTGSTTSTTHTVGGVHSGVPEGTAGPHSSRVGNAADPRIDSDLDGRGAGGAGVTGGNTGHHSGVTGGSTGSTGVGYGSTGAAGSTTAPHSSNIANKLDPRVDATTANTYGGTNTGTTHTGNTQGGFTGTSGGISNSTNAGPHDSNMANKLDPRVDSDLDGRGNRHGAATGVAAGITGASGSHATPGSGTAQNTAGPHNSDTLNKLDPRVDADLDGSTTLGGNRTRV